MEYISVESSNIEKIGYDDQKRQLHIIFLKKSHYVYFDVPNNTWEEFLASDSKGRFFARFIKGLYAFQNVTGQVEVN
jgi:hypothetical protein